MKKALGILLLIALATCCRTQTIVMSEPLHGSGDTVQVRRVIRQ